jgi:NDP-sugar pyrophosphorylase family protein
MRTILVSTGYLADKVDEHLAKSVLGVKVNVVRENIPLGTGGALLNAIDSFGLPFDNVLVVNGDTLFLGDLGLLSSALVEYDLDGVMFGVRVDEACRYGSLRVNDVSLLVSFDEKQGASGLVNAGIFLLRRDILCDFKRGKELSLEYEIIPELLLSGARIKVVETDAPFVDIGTPASLQDAQKFVELYSETFLEMQRAM